MEDHCFRMDEGLALARLADPSAGTEPLPVVEIGGRGALVKTALHFQENEYIDVAIELKGGRRYDLFAHVVGSGDEGLRLRWLHFDPSEGQRLGDAIAAFAQSQGCASMSDPLAEAAPVASSGRRQRSTRKVLRPRSDAVPAEALSSEGEGAPEEPEAKRKTRRVTRPSSKQAPVSSVPAEGPADEETPSEATADEEGNGETPRQGRRYRRTSTVAPFAVPEAIAPSATSETVERQGTRRVTRPAVKPTPTPEPAAESAASSSSGPEASVSSAGETSGPRHVVLEKTGRFEQRSQPAPATEAERLDLGHIVGADGKIDVGASLRSRAKEVNAAELAARHDKVRVLNMRTIKELIQDAVKEAMTLLGGSIDEAERTRLLQEAEEQFQERLKAFNAEKQGLEAQAKELGSQLERAQRLLEEERKKSIEADQFTVSEAGISDLEGRFKRLLEHAIVAKNAGPELAEDLRGMIAHLLDSERAKVAEREQEAQNQAIALLEKKIGRLANSLEATEKERDQARRMAAALEASGGGLRNVIDAGLDDEDPGKARKLELLKVVFEQNTEMREAMKAKGLAVPTGPARPAASKESAGETAPSEAPDEAGALVASSAGAVEMVAAEELSAANDGDLPEEELAGGSYDDLSDPDDEVWTPGMSFSQDVKGDNEDEGADDAVKKITGYAAFEPPPLERAAEAADDAGPAVADDTEDGPEAETLANPDDMPWEPDTSDTAGSGESADPAAGSSVKKIAVDTSLEPPPLQRG